MKNTFLFVLLLIASGAIVYFVLFNDPADEREAAQSGSQDSLVVGDSSRGSEPDPRELERQQRLTERARPQDYVALNYEQRRNLLGEMIIEGSLTNNSELTLYKDFQLMIYFTDSEGSIQDSASQVVFEQLVPGETAPFKLKEKAPRKAKALLKIQEAKAEDIPKQLRAVEN